MRQKWSREIVCKAIQDLHTAGERLNSHYVQLQRQTLYRAATKYFGSWKSAVEMAGLEYSQIRLKKLRRWDQARIVQAVEERYKQGLAINGRAVSEQDRGLYLAARRHFGKGGWRKVLCQAGFDPQDLDPKRIWTASKIIESIHRLQEAATPLYAYYLVTHDNESLVAGAIGRFGSWKKAVEAAGLDYEAVRSGRCNWWSRERVVDEIKRLAEQGTQLSSKSTQLTRGDLFAAAIVRFGSWSEAVAAAGIDYRQHARTWSSKAWLRQLAPHDVRKISERARELAKRKGRK